MADKSTEFSTNLSRKDFSAAYTRFIRTHCNRGGTAIFNVELDAILLVKSIASGKWGLPKGLYDTSVDKGDLSTAIRETEEEIGVLIRLVVPLLPSIIVEDAKIYGVILPVTTKLALEAKEISEAKWFYLNYLTDSTKDKGLAYTRMLRVFIQRKKMLRLQMKVNIYKNNYINTKGVFNDEVSEVLKNVEKAKGSILHKAYNKFVMIQSKYPTVFSQNDILACIRYI